MGIDVWRILSEWLDRWRLIKRTKSSALEDTNPAHKHVSSQYELDHSPDTKQLVKDILAQLSRDVKSGQSVRQRPPTPGPR